MRLSKLQKYILTSFYLNKQKVKLKADFYNFYPKDELTRNIQTIQEIIHNSLDNLVDKDLLIAFGHKTSQKWFIHKVRLTNKGKKMARQLIKNRQRRLPIK